MYLIKKRYSKPNWSFHWLISTPYEHKL
jgi:hypothetical protein